MRHIKPVGLKCIEHINYNSIYICLYLCFVIVLVVLLPLVFLDKDNIQKISICASISLLAAVGMTSILVKRSSINSYKSCKLENCSFESLLMFLGSNGFDLVNGISLEYFLFKMNNWYLKKVNLTAIKVNKGFAIYGEERIVDSIVSVWERQNTCSNQLIANEHCKIEN